MKRISIILISFLISINAFAQLQTHEMPLSSFLKNNKRTEIPQKDLQAIDIEAELKKDEVNNIENRYGVCENVAIDIKKEGATQRVEASNADEVSGTLYLYKIYSPNSKSLRVTFGNYYLPEGAKLFIYSPDHSVTAGAFTSINNKESGILPIADMALAIFLILKGLLNILTESFLMPCLAKI